MPGEAREKCAVAGVLTDQPDGAAGQLYAALFALQHRGTEASGMTAQLPDGKLETHFGTGLVRDIYDDKELARRFENSNPVIGHNRYSTSGSKMAHPQPVTDKAVGWAMGHNGNLPDTEKLEAFLSGHNIRHRHLNDSEMMSVAVSQLLREGYDLPEAIERTYPFFTGAFSCVGMQDDALVAFRDPFGIRPLALGKLGNGWAVSSETCGLDINNATHEREVRPGELVIITKDGLESRQLVEGTEKLDIFEFVYFARHDSYLYGQSVNEVRRQFGERLAAEHPPLTDQTGQTVVVPVPDTSMPEAEGYAESLGLNHNAAIIKNRFIGRTFMAPSQEERQEKVRYKHSIVGERVRGKDVILVDDSIVRLNTMPRIVELVKSVGARSVAVLIGSPPVRFPDFYGIDTPHQSELSAANLTVEQMRQKIGCEYLGFLSLDGMVKATGLPAHKFNLSCFTGEYPIDIGARKKEISVPVSMEFVE